ncbi:MAG TPA: NHL repeat-containing protein, partial [Acidimicrobiia bacterium]
VFNDQGTKLFEFGTPGGGDGQFRAPRGVGFDAADNLYVADTTNSRIQVYALGASSATHLRSWTDVGDFRGLTVDKARGWVYVVNAGKGLIDKFDLLGNSLGSFGGWGTGPGKFLDGGRGITVDGDGNVWVGDMPNFRAQKFTPTGGFLLQAPNPAAPPPPGGFAMPGSTALDAAGNLFVMDTYNWRVQKLANNGTFVRQWGRRGGAVDQFGLQYPRGIAVDLRDGSVVVADTDNTAIKKYSNDGAFLWALSGIKAFSVAVGPDGTIYAVDFAQNVVVRVTPAGAPAGTFGAGWLSNPRGVDVDPDGSIWVASRDSGVISHFSAAGSLLGQFGSKGSADTQLTQAAEIESDSQRVYVADQTANKIKVWTKAGAFVGAFGGGGTGLGRFKGPMGLDLTPAGRLYVTEMSGERVQEFAVTG